MNLQLFHYKYFGRKPGETKPYYKEPGLDFWRCIDRVQVEKGDGQISWLDIKGPRPFICSEMECHDNCSTTIIQMEGQSVILFGLSQKPNLINTCQILILYYTSFYLSWYQGSQSKTGNMVLEQISLNSESFIYLYSG